MRSDYLVSTHGTVGEPPIDLDRVELESLEPVAWDGASERVAAEDGIVVRTRRFAVMFGQDGEPGPRKESVRLRDGERIVGEQAVNWEVIAPIAVAPKVLALVPGKVEHRLTLTSADGRSFGITQAESDVPGLHLALPDGAAPVQTVVIHHEPTEQTRAERGVVTLHTDHPANARLEVPVVIIR